MKQKEAVFSAFTSGSEQGLTNDALAEFVIQQVFNGITDGTVDYSKPRDDEKAVRSYAGALQSNWFKKDTRISGAKYVPANPRGPRIVDDTLKALNVSLKSLKAHGHPDMNLIMRVESAIESRLAIVQSTKAASKVQSLETSLATLADLGIEV